VYRVLPKRVGRRGTCLIAISYLTLISGITQLHQQPQARAAEPYCYLLAAAPAQVWGWAWITAGVLALIGAFSYRVRNVAYGAILFLTCLYLIGFTAAAIGGAYRGWVLVGWYTAWLIIFQVIAGWPEPGQARIPHPRWRRRGPQ
jgi:hypothetical protein